MKIIDLPTTSIEPPAWNPNRMDEGMKSRLKSSIQRFGVVVPLVVRSIGPDRYETVGGAQRLSVLRDFGIRTLPCVVVETDDIDARLLGQSLNHIAGEDDLGLRAAVVRDILQSLPLTDVLAVLPDSAESLRDLAAIGQDTIAQRLTAWQTARSARLRHLQFQLTSPQLHVVERALQIVVDQGVDDGESPNRKGTALAMICEKYLAEMERHHD